jgi:hypothetical protein
MTKAAATRLGAGVERARDAGEPVPGSGQAAYLVFRIEIGTAVIPGLDALRRGGDRRAAVREGVEGGGRRRR